MLKELTIKNYALIDSLTIEFDRGLNVLTGETGAGKSIIVDALGLLLGQKAHASLIRKGCERCEISGSFDLEKNPQAKEFLESLSLQNSEERDSLFLRREADVYGKSRSYINDRAASLSTLSGLGDLLVEIHSQNEHQQLLKPAEQKNFLDRYAGVESIREEVARLYAQWKGLMGQQSASQLSEQERNRKMDLYQFQVQEIDSAKLSPGEEDELERMLPQLKNAERLRAVADELYAQLYDADDSALARLRKSQKLVSTIRHLGIEFNEGSALLDETIMRVEELVNALQSFRGNLVSDPHKLDATLARQDFLFKLKKKYGAIIPEILDYRDKVSCELKQLEGHLESAEELSRKIEESYARLMQECKKLSLSRRKSADKLSMKIERELKDLGFHKARFLIRFESQKDESGKEVPTGTGLENVEFLFSANPGEDVQSLKNGASGGELSRLMLALKKILAQADLVPCLIFDEVDAGIGGSMGHVIGEKLKSLSQLHQVLVITHLPQIAAFAERQIAVRKNEANKRTQTVIELLEREKRVREIARMLGGTATGGEDPTSASLRHAAELLENANRS